MTKPNIHDLPSVEEVKKLLDTLPNFTELAGFNRSLRSYMRDCYHCETNTMCELFAEQPHAACDQSGNFRQVKTQNGICIAYPTDNNVRFICATCRLSYYEAWDRIGTFELHQNSANEFLEKLKRLTNYRDAESKNAL